MPPPPRYCARPHVVALNKMDLDDAALLRAEVADDIMAVARQTQADWVGVAEAESAPPSLPLHVVACSALTGTLGRLGFRVWGF